MAIWKMPNRTQSNAITQSFNDGMIDIFAVVDEADPGYQPKPTRRHKYTLPFAERTVGVTRFYAAAQAQMTVSAVVRVPAAPGIDTQDVAIIGGKLYRIDLVQRVQDVFPACCDLTLYAVRQGEGCGCVV